MSCGNFMTHLGLPGLDASFRFWRQSRQSSKPGPPISRPLCLNGGVFVGYEIGTFGGRQAGIRRQLIDTLYPSPVGLEGENSVSLLLVAQPRSVLTFVCSEYPDEDNLKEGAPWKS